jgi:mitochondrial fission protein ELM1
VFNDKDYKTYIFNVLDPEAFDPIGQISTDGWRVMIRTWDRETVLLKSTLTHQSENAHLGYTDTQYNPIKKYLINNPTPDSFTITTWGASTDKPVEFASDGRDYIVLECVVEY